MTGSNLTLRQLLRHEDNACADASFPAFPTVRRSVIVCGVVLILMLALVQWVVG